MFEQVALLIVCFRALVVNGASFSASVAFMVLIPAKTLTSGWFCAVPILFILYISYFSAFVLVGGCMTIPLTH